MLRCERPGDPALESVPLNDLGRSEDLSAVLLRAAEDVLRSGWFVMGPAHDAFEREWAAYCGTRHAVAVASGTDALELSLRAVGVGPGDEVITVANAGMYATAATVVLGAVPVFAEVDPSTQLMDPASVEQGLSEHTRAIVVTHLYGRMADMDAILALASRARVPLIEDCAQAHGAIRGDHRVGSLGTLAPSASTRRKTLAPSEMAAQS